MKEIYKHIEFVEFINVYKMNKIPPRYHFLNEDSPDFLLVAENSWFITDQDNYKMSGNIEFNEFDISNYNILLGENNISGNIDFSVKTKRQRSIL